MPLAFKFFNLLCTFAGTPDLMEIKDEIKSTVFTSFLINLTGAPTSILDVIIYEANSYCAVRKTMVIFLNVSTKIRFSLTVITDNNDNMIR